MVSVISAYRIINHCILRVANDLVGLDVLEVQARSSYVRLEESAYSVAETQERLSDTVVVAHDLSQYINRFYSINLTTNDTVWLNHLIGHRVEDIDLTEFGEYA